MRQDPGEIDLKGGEDMASFNSEQLVAFLLMLVKYAECKGEYFTAEVIREILHKISNG